MAKLLILERITGPQSHALRAIITLSNNPVIRANSGWFEPVALQGIHKPGMMCRALTKKGYLVESRSGMGYKLRDGIAEAIDILIDGEEE